MGAKNATFALIDIPPGSSTVGNQLRVTPGHRRALRLTLRKIFGPSLDGGASENKTYLDNAASLLDDFLADPSWLSKVEK